MPCHMQTIEHSLALLDTGPLVYRSAIKMIWWRQIFYSSLPILFYSTYHICRNRGECQCEKSGSAYLSIRTPQPPRLLGYSKVCAAAEQSLYFTAYYWMRWMVGATGYSPLSIVNSSTKFRRVPYYNSPRLVAFCPLPRSPSFNKTLVC